MPSALPRKILIIDDSRDMLALLCEYLIWEGFEPVALSRVSEALELLRHPNQVDLVLCDCNLGDGNGMDVASEVRLLNPSMPVILMSGFETAEIKKQALEAGARAFVTKTDGVKAIMSAVHAALAGTQVS